jgi:hypothetical protein
MSNLNKFFEYTNNSNLNLKTQSVMKQLEKPQILLDLVNYLKTNNLIAESNINGEGRVASLKDEESVISFLKKSDKFSKYIVDVAARKAGDFYLLDYDNITTHIWCCARFTRHLDLDVGQ